MAVWFRSLCSGSSGNAVLVWNETTRLLFDCGVSAQYRCREMLDAHGGPAGLAAVVVSHLHGDHIGYSSLRVLEERGMPLYLHEENAGRLARFHFRGRPFRDLDVRAFGREPFRIGDFNIRPFAVPHAPWLTTHAFAVTCGRGPRATRLVIATDLCDWREAREDFLDADLLYVEANHDPELLRRNPNPNSAFHLENGRTGELLCEVLRRSRRPPTAVILAHLSEERNTPAIALATVRSALSVAGCDAPPLRVAPRYAASDVVVVA